MAQFTGVQDRIAKCRARLKQIDTQLAELGSTCNSTGATADSSGVLHTRIETITSNFTPISREIADIRASVVS